MPKGQDSSTQQGRESLKSDKSDGTQPGESVSNKQFRKELHHTQSADYNELEMHNGNIFNIVNNNNAHKKSKSKSTDDMRIENEHNGGISLDSSTLKRMLKPMSSIDSPVTSPEMTRKRHSHYHYYPSSNNNQRYYIPGADNENYARPYRPSYNNKYPGCRSAQEIGRPCMGNSFL